MPVGACALSLCRRMNCIDARPMKCANPMARLAEERRPSYPLPHSSAPDGERDDLGLNGLARFQITASPVQRWPRGGLSSGARPCVTAWPCIAPRHHPVPGCKANISNAEHHPEATSTTFSIIGDSCSSRAKCIRRKKNAIDPWLHLKINPRKNEFPP